MNTAICSKCGREFATFPSWGDRAFCSRRCFLTYERPPELWFWARVSRSASMKCWEWQGSLNGDGYGLVKVSHRDTDGFVVKWYCDKAHRVSWRLENGDIPDGTSVLHRCDNRRCVNPSHLFLGTLADNMTDRNAKGRQAARERHPRAKLTQSEVSEIRNARQAGETQVSLASRFCVSRRTIRSILDGQTWN